MNEFLKIMAKVGPMSRKDKERLLQCILCKHDPEDCGCTEADEDKDGFCVKAEYDKI